MPRRLLLAALLLGGCEANLAVRYDLEMAPGHAVGAELTLSRSE